VEARIAANGSAGGGFKACPVHHFNLASSKKSLSRPAIELYHLLADVLRRRSATPTMVKVGFAASGVPKALPSGRNRVAFTGALRDICCDNRRKV